MFVNNILPLHPNPPVDNQIYYASGAICGYESSSFFVPRSFMANIDLISANFSSDKTEYCIGQFDQLEFLFQHYYFRLIFLLFIRSNF